MDGNLFVHKLATADAKDDILSAISLPTLSEAGEGGIDILDGADVLDRGGEAKDGERRARAGRPGQEAHRPRARRQRCARASPRCSTRTPSCRSQSACRARRSMSTRGCTSLSASETEARLEEKKLEMAYDTEKINLSAGRSSRAPSSTGCPSSTSPSPVSPTACGALVPYDRRGAVAQGGDRPRALAHRQGAEAARSATRRAPPRARASAAARATRRRRAARRARRSSPR